jgi:antitoxin (DNA-binding transcriptional repressor) of toxin-antitoxin stability system
MGVPAVDLKDVPQRLLDLVDEASRNGELVLTHEGEAVAKIIPLRRARTPRRPGSERGLIIHMADDFDAIPEDFRDYM